MAKRLERSYDSNFIFLALYDNNFSELAKKNVPSSTYSTWKKNGIAHLYGKEYFPYPEDAIEIAKELAKSKKLIAAAKALVHINSVHSKIFANLNSKRKFITQYKRDFYKSFVAASKHISKKKTYKLLGISAHHINYHPIKVCETSLLNKCLKKHPNQLSNSEIKNIQKYFSLPQYKLWQAISIYWEMKRFGTLHCSKTTFYRYANKLNLIVKYRKRLWNNLTQIKASGVFEYIHMDVSHINLNNLKGYLYLIVDNYSRAILSYTFSKIYSSKISVTNLIKASKTHNIHLSNCTTLITDGGPENKAYVDRFLNLKGIQLIKKVALSDIHSTNCLVESVIRQLKQHHIKLDANDDFERASRAIDFAINDYHNKPLDVHNGLNAIEILNQIPISLKLNQKEKLKILDNRKTENKLNSCINCKI